MGMQNFMIFQKKEFSGEKKAVQEKYTQENFDVQSSRVGRAIFRGAAGWRPSARMWLDNKPARSFVSTDGWSLFRSKLFIPFNRAFLLHGFQDFSDFWRKCGVFFVQIHIAVTSVHDPGLIQGGGVYCFGR